MLINKLGNNYQMIDDMYPWEREVWVHMVIEQLKEEEKQQKQNEA